MGADVLRKEKTMQLLIKQRVFSWTDTYDVYDEKEEPKYFVKAEFFALGHQIHVYDKSGREVGMVKQRLLTLPSGIRYRDRWKRIRKCAERVFLL